MYAWLHEVAWNSGSRLLFQKVIGRVWGSGFSVCTANCALWKARLVVAVGKERNSYRWKSAARQSENFDRSSTTANCSPSTRCRTLTGKPLASSLIPRGRFGKYPAYPNERNGSRIFGLPKNLSTGDVSSCECRRWLYLSAASRKSYT